MNLLISGKWYSTHAVNLSLSRILQAVFLILCSAFSLMKNYTARPNYSQLLEFSFIKEHAQKDTDVAKFVGEILDLPENEQPA